MQIQANTELQRQVAEAVVELVGIVERETAMLGYTNCNGTFTLKLQGRQVVMSFERFHGKCLAVLE